MPWVRLDEQFPDHPKVQVVGPLASWLHVCALAYCNRLLTDGFVPTNKVGTLADFSEVWDQPDGAADFGVDPYRLADRLCEARMWKKVTGGYQLHDYHDYQPSRADEHEKRRQKAEAGAKGGKASGESRRRSEATSEANGKQTGSTTAAECFDAGSRSVEAKANPDPTRTDTDLELQKRGARSSSKALSLVRPEPPPPTASARGKRIPDFFQVTPAMHEWAARETPGVNVATETAKFCDYWASEAGQKARKLDWVRAWQVWMRRANEGAQRRTSSTPAARSADAMLAWAASQEAGA
jgi:hypothetical protein